MWTLECDGPVLRGKQIWLKPGSRLLVGRTRPSKADGDTGSYLIDHKSVSRRHIIISVEDVEPGTGSQLRTKSKLIIDERSKLGTTMDGKKVHGTIDLAGDEHTIQLGNYEHLLRIKWRPVVLTITSLSKTQKRSDDPLGSIRSKLEKYDVKFTTELIVGSTTHVVAAKRNQPVVLEALVHGKHIVTGAYIQAIVDAVTPQPNAEDPENPLPAPLEDDFEKNWPSTAGFIPPPGKEPVVRPESYFAPNPQRYSIFSQYIFVFCDSTQFDNLKGVVNGGDGKALLYEDFELGQTRPEDFVAYVKQVAGLKDPDASIQGKKVVVVRLAAKTETEWTEKFVQDADLLLGQRSFAQNEFLDAILTVDTRSFCQPLSEEEEQGPINSPVRQDTTTARPTKPNAPPQVETTPARPTTRNTTYQPEPASPRPTRITAVATRQQPAPARRAARETSPVREPSPPKEPFPPPRNRTPEPPKPKRRPLRTVTESRFKGFDDFNPNEIVSVPDDDDDGMMTPPDQTPATSLAPPQASRAVSGTKRRSSVTGQDEEIDKLLPAAAAMKKRRLNTNDPREKTVSPKAKPMRKPKPERQIDVMEEVRKAREAAEQDARLDEDALKAAMEEMDIDSIRLAVKIEIMEVKPRGALAERVGDEGRWDDRWNGRKNFKRFRRKGQDVPRRGQRVIIPLEESIKQPSERSRDEFAVPTGESTSRSGLSSTVASQLGRLGEDSDDETSFRRQVARSARGRPRVAESVTIEMDDESVAGASTVAKSYKTAKTTKTAGSTGTARKRPAAAEAEQPAARRRKVIVQPEPDSDDSDDALRFRRR
ncbi:hypothetical protein EJ06DRAFT_547238 [Trichodelitschia bisporula]|uniref:FHA domain-containing protein n=1 Tax=Trichodelitschia bisporula TaxID=703511 RepID=A0A6G1I467_9PEZI|nr:hypothetical protein EJ06DRAFT_547238 [Trichodelitschia bisporula]